MPMLISLKDFTCLRVSGVLLCPTFSTSRLLLAEGDSFRRGDTVATIAGPDSARAPHVSGDSDGCVLSRLLQHAFASVSQISLPLLSVHAFLCIRALSSGHVFEPGAIQPRLPLISAHGLPLISAHSPPPPISAHSLWCAELVPRMRVCLASAPSLSSQRIIRYCISSPPPPYIGFHETVHHPNDSSDPARCAARPQS
jgi:hypothetical protein